ncbi:energy transducer TonB [Tunicatimonas pelagia]|uniref:energy transducer TonB n=1 Tax=Tunicatimonas pelagia TaxID=931531 RepID=UPI002666E2CF|nr:energy transducer TonB [Tunicatimonas pelagia]WKN41078.1 energy transducer TonB [Tunicatimonas pelagia]
MKLTYRCMFNDRPPSDPAQWQDFDQLLIQYQQAQQTRSNYRRWLYGAIIAMGLGLAGWGIIYWIDAPQVADLPTKVTALPPQLSGPENPLRNEGFTSQIQAVPLPERKTSSTLNTEALPSKPKAKTPAKATSQFEEAQPIGGYPALYEYFADHLQYPEAARRDQAEGSVLVEFYINEEGHPDQIRILQSVREDIDEEAIRLIKSMPEWAPAQVNGKPVATKHTMPLTFQLDDNL